MEWLPSSFENCHRLYMRSLRKHIHDAQVGESIAIVADYFTVTHQTGGLAGYIDDDFGSEARNDPRHLESP